MADRTPHPIPIAGIVGLGLIASVAFATPTAALDFGAEEEAELPVSASVTAGDWAVDVGISARRRGGEVTVSVSGGDEGCEITARLVPGLGAIPIADEIFDDAVAIRIIECESAIVEDRWVPVVDLDAAARELALDHLERVLGPDLSIGHSPPANVLVGLSTWFWLEGYRGDPLRTTVATDWGETLDLSLTLAELTWDFGDGSSPVAGTELGEPYPAESEVQHVYEVRSTSRAEPDGAYQLIAGIALQVTYTHDGDGPYSAGTITTTHEQPIVVHQLQAVLTHP